MTEKHVHLFFKTEKMRGAEEDSDPEQALDEWFLESLKTYKDLHVFQLEHPTRVLEWTSGRTVCVAGFSTSSKNEILELSLPLRLLAEQNKGLCAERDFKVVHGGFSDAPIHSLQHIPGTRFAVSNDGVSSSLQIWDLGGDDTDVIRRSGCVEAKGESSDPAERAQGAGCRLERGRRLAAPLSPGSEPRVLHGATTNDVQLTDVRTGQELYRLACPVSEPLSSLQFLADGAFACGSVNGGVLVADSRSPAAPVSHAPPSARAPERGPWSAAFRQSSVVRSSVSGRTVVSDLRRMDTVAAQAQVAAGDGKHGGSLNVSWAPALENYIALSGVTGLVQVYDTSLWGAELQPAVPQFEHRGHTVSSPGADVIAVSHAWHPERPRTLLSAASDASLHAWDWNSQSERRE